VHGHGLNSSTAECDKAPLRRGFFFGRRPTAGLSGALLTPPQPARKPRPGERVAQMVEHLTFNQVVLGSSPSALTSKIKGFYAL
jgi:hypothetical protein